MLGENILLALPVVLIVMLSFIFGERFILALVIISNRVLIICNFTPVPRHNYRVGVQGPGTYVELLNSDASTYGGSNCGNAGAVTAEAVPMHGRPYSVPLVLPPLGALFLKLQ